MANTRASSGRSWDQRLGLHVVMACAAGIALLGACGRPAARTENSATTSAPETTRAGKVFIATFKDGPMDELRLLRDTAGGVVVYGATDFPEGTRVRVQLIEPAAGGAGRALAMTTATVELGHFTSQPLNSSSGPPGPGLVAVRVAVSFAPGVQPDAVQAAAGRGLRYHGNGMIPSPDHADYSISMEAPL